MQKFKKEEKKLKRKMFKELIKYNFLKDKNIEYKEVKYGDNKRNYYRVYEDYDKRKPVMFYINGGWFWKGSPKVCAAIGKFFRNMDLLLLFHHMM